MEKVGMASPQFGSEGHPARLCIIMMQTSHNYNEKAGEREVRSSLLMLDWKEDRL